MRISGGKHKNRKIHTALKNTDVNYRPTSDRTRQAIFNILSNSNKFTEDCIEGRVVLDLYCGSGSFGIEILSRDAQHVIFVDQSQDQLKLVEKNLSTLNEGQNSRLLKYDATNLPPSSIQVELVFIDPPYKCNLVNKTITSLIKKNWLKDGSIIIVEHFKKEDINFSDTLKLLDERVYGKTKLSFCKYEEQS